MGGAAEQDYAVLSYFGRLNYAYKQRYLFEANFRRDGSSRFGPDYRWGTFPSFSAAWRINEESFMDDLKSVFIMLIVLIVFIPLIFNFIFLNINTYGYQNFSGHAQGLLHAS